MRLYIGCLAAYNEGTRFLHQPDPKIVGLRLTSITLLALPAYCPVGRFDNRYPIKEKDNG